MIRHFIARSIIVGIGLCFAWVTGAAFLILAAFGRSAFAGLGDPATAASLFVASFGAMWIVGSLAFLPALIGAAIAEALAARSVVFHALGGAAAALIGLEGGGFESAPDMRLILGATGAVAGLAYWAFAGRRAGEGITRRARPPADAS